MDRSKRAAMAEETVRVVEAGRYVGPSGRVVGIGEAVERSVAGTRVVVPEEWEGVVAEARGLMRREEKAVVEVTGETTLEAARRLVGVGGKVGALNFASAKNPGGGFLEGSQAQEESLARASGLYVTLLAGRAYYEANREEESRLYTDHAIWSPGVPVFRGEDGGFLEEPYEVSFITMPAPNRGAMDEGSAGVGMISEVLKRRMRGICALAAMGGVEQLVLGAWGCGVFRNDAGEVARCFEEVLFAEGWAGWFGRVCFAVFDRSEGGEVRGAFEEVLGKWVRGGEYVEPYRVDESAEPREQEGLTALTVQEAEAALGSETEEKVALTLWSIACFSPDVSFSESVFRKYLEDERTELRYVATVGFGYLARLHADVFDFEGTFDLLFERVEDREEKVADAAKSSLWDYHVYRWDGAAYSREVFERRLGSERVAEMFCGLRAVTMNDADVGYAMAWCRIFQRHTHPAIRVAAVWGLSRMVDRDASGMKGLVKNALVELEGDPHLWVCEAAMSALEWMALAHEDG